MPEQKKHISKGYSKDVIPFKDEKEFNSQAMCEGESKTLTVEKVREMLGEQSALYSDDQINKMIDKLYKLALVAYESAIAEKMILLSVFTSV